MNSLKTRIHGLRSENHVEAQDIDDLEWIDDFNRIRMEKKRKQEMMNAAQSSYIPNKVSSKENYESSEHPSRSIYDNLAEEFNIIMK